MQLLIRKADATRELRPIEIAQPQARTSLLDTRQAELQWPTEALKDGSIRYLPPTGPAEVIAEWAQTNPVSAALFGIAERVQVEKDMQWRTAQGEVIEAVVDDSATLAEIEENLR